MVLMVSDNDGIDADGISYDDDDDDDDYGNDGCRW